MKNLKKLVLAKPPLVALGAFRCARDEFSLAAIVQNLQTLALQMLGLPLGREPALALSAPQAAGWRRSPQRRYNRGAAITQSHIRRHED
jgi:hypothetical protein